jgi:hypothetical protein
MLCELSAAEQNVQGLCHSSTQIKFEILTSLPESGEKKPERRFEGIAIA